MTWNIKKTVTALALGLLVLIASLALGFLPVNLFFAKPAIEEAAREQLGVELRIEGPLRARLGFKPTISVSQIRVGMGDIAPLEEVRIDSLEARTRMASVFRSEIDLQHLSAQGIALTGTAGIDDHLLPSPLDLDAAAPLDGPITVELTGHVVSEPLRLAAVGASLSSLLEDPDSYPVELEFDGLFSELRMDGAVRRPLSDPALESSLGLEVGNLPALLAAFGQDQENWSRLALDSQVLAGFDEIRVERLDGLLDDIPFQLSGSVRDLDARPRVEVDAGIPQVDISRFTDGEDTPGIGSDNAADDLQPLFRLLGDFDGRATVRVGEIINLPRAMEAMNLLLDATLKQGILSVDRAGVLAAGSEISGNVRLDTTADCESLRVELDIRDFDLAWLSGEQEEEAGPEGVLDKLSVKTESCGRSIGSHVQSLTAHARAGGLELHFGEEALPLTLERLEADIGWNQPGSVSFEGELLHEPLSLSTSFDSVSTILEDRASAIRLSAQNAGLNMTADGSAELGESGLGLDLGLTVDVARLGSLHAWLGTEPKSRLPFRGRMRVRLDESGLFLEDLDATLGRSDVSGSLDWPVPESSLPLIVALDASHVDLDELADLFPESPGQEPDESADWAELLEDSEWAGRWFDLPFIEIDIQAASLHGLLEDVEGVRLGARLQDKSVREGQLAFRMAGIDFVGAMEADFSALPWTVHFESTLNNIDIGRLMASLELRDDVTARAGRVDIGLDSRGDTLRQLVMNGRMDSRIESLEWTLQGGPKRRAFEIRLSELEMTTRPSSDTIWQTRGELNGSPVRAWMRTPSINETFDTSRALPIRLVLGSPEGTIMVDTVIDPVSNEGSGANLVVSGMFRGGEDIDLAGLESPLGDYAFQVRALVREDEFLKTEFQGRIASSRAAGKFDIFVLGDGLRFELDLDSPYLETDDLVNWAEDFRNAHEVVTAGIPAEEARENMNVGILKLLDEYIREYSGRNEFNVAANVDELHSSGKLFGQMELELTLAGNDLRIEPLTIALPGGRVDISYHSGGFGAKGVYELDVDVDRLEYGGLLRLLDPESRAEGEMFLDIDLVSHAPQADQVVHNLAGHVDMAVFPVDVKTGFLDLWASNLIFALLSTGDDLDKQLNCLVARFDVEDGVMNAKNAFLDSTEVIVRARGDIDLGQRQLDLLVAPQSKREKFLSVSTPIAVTGPFDDFQVGVAPGGFLTTMIRWYYGIIYVPWKWLTGERFPPDGIATCRRAMGWETAAD